MPTTTDVTKILTDPALAALRTAYVEAELIRALSLPMPAQYPGSQALVSAIQTEFYGDGKTTAPSTGMSALERERILIALLASRGGRLTLAIHIYAGLMAGASPADIASILLLTGVYTGIDRLAEGLTVQRDTVTLLQALVDQKGPLDAVTVCTAIGKAYPSSESPLRH